MSSSSLVDIAIKDILLAGRTNSASKTEQTTRLTSLEIDLIFAQLVYFLLLRLLGENQSRSLTPCTFTYLIQRNMLILIRQQQVAALNRVH